MGRSPQHLNEKWAQRRSPSIRPTFLPRLAAYFLGKNLTGMKKRATVEECPSIRPTFLPRLAAYFPEKNLTSA
jgi:hypothetical protein